MSFSPLMTLLTASLIEALPPSPTVIELGNQRFRPGDRVLERVCDRLADSPRVDQAALAGLRQSGKKERLDKTEAFYRALGFADYKAIDVNEKYGSLIMDLNRDLEQDYGYAERFSLVTNNGTGEHVFNQHSVFKNVHALCETGGLMVHVMPFVYYVNHGFYSYHPGLYHDLARANGYRLLLLGFAERGGRGVLCAPGGPARDAAQGEIPGPVLLDDRQLSLQDMLGKPDFRAFSLLGRLTLLKRAVEARVFGRVGNSSTTSPALSRALARLISTTSTRKIMVFAVFRKDRDQPFQIPFQGLYNDDIGDAAIAGDYAHD